MHARPDATMPAPAEIDAARAATISGPTTKMTSWMVASRAYAVVRSSGRGSIAGHIIRIVGPTGGMSSPATAVAATSTPSATRAGGGAAPAAPAGGGGGARAPRGEGPPGGALR